MRTLLADSDSELLSRYQSDGDENAFRSLVERYQSMVVATALRRISNVEMAREVAQEVFATLARKARSLIGRTSVGGWLHQATVYQSSRLLQSELRRQERQQRFSAEQTMTAAEPPQEGAAGSDQLAVLDEALDLLSDSDREVIVLHYFQDLSYSEMSNVLGANEPAIRQRVSRALERLGKRLKQRGLRSGNAAMALLAAVAIQSTVGVPAGIARAALAIAGAGGGGVSLLSLSAVVTSSAAKKVAAAVAVAGLAATWTVSEQKDRFTKDGSAALVATETAPEPSANVPSASAPDAPRQTAFAFSASQPDQRLALTARGSGGGRVGGAALAFSGGGASGQAPTAVDAGPRKGATRVENAKPALSPKAQRSQVPALPVPAGQSAATSPRSPVEETTDFANSPAPSDSGSAGGDAPPSDAPSNPDPLSPIVRDLLDELGEIANVPDLLGELRRIEQIPHQAGELYGELLGRTLALTGAQTDVVKNLLENSFEQLNLQGLTGPRPLEVPQEIWEVAREEALAPVGDELKMLLADVPIAGQTVDGVLKLTDSLDLPLSGAGKGEGNPEAADGEAGGSPLSEVTGELAQGVGGVVEEVLKPVGAVPKLLDSILKPPRKR